MSCQVILGIVSPRLRNSLSTAAHPWDLRTDPERTKTYNSHTLIKQHDNNFREGGNVSVIKRKIFQVQALTLKTHEDEVGCRLCLP